MDVGVRELKQHLSEYLDRAAAGEQLVVTDRGVPKALIGPVPGGGQLERGVEEGWVRSPVRSGALAPIRRVSGRARVLDSLGEDRNE
jgi:prevent-host-death family protein